MAQRDLAGGACWLAPAVDAGASCICQPATSPTGRCDRVTVLSAETLVVASRTGRMYGRGWVFITADAVCVAAQRAGHWRYLVVPLAGVHTVGVGRGPSGLLRSLRVETDTAKLVFRVRYLVDASGTSILLRERRLAQIINRIFQAGGGPGRSADDHARCGS